MSEMKVTPIIQARMGSKRFPGKSFYAFEGISSLEHMIDSVNQVFPLSEIFIATSDKKVDDTIANYAKEKGTGLFRGDEENVASRFLEVVKATECDFFIRLNGDSPLLDYRVINLTLEELNKREFQPEMITTMSGGYPSGMNVEVVKSRTFIGNYNKFSEADDFEHVTKFFKDRDAEYEIVYLKSGIENMDQYKFSFDTVEDCERLTRLFKVLEKPHYYYSLKEKCEILEKVTEQAKS